MHTQHPQRPRLNMGYLHNTGPGGSRLLRNTAHPQGRLNDYQVKRPVLPSVPCANVSLQGPACCTRTAGGLDHKPSLSINTGRGRGTGFEVGIKLLLVSQKAVGNVAHYHYSVALKALPTHLAHV